MNWEELAWEGAERLDKADEIFAPDGHDWVFVLGADWMRDQLRTNEAIERVALWLTGMLTPFEDWPSNEDLEGGPAGDRDVEFKEAWMKEARAAITALLGGET